MGIRNFLIIVVVYLCVFSFFVSTKAQAQTPVSPTGVSAISGNTEASITWDFVSGATEYVVYRSTYIDGPFAFVGLTQVNGHADQNLSNGSTYYYVVTALNEGGQSPYSLPVAATPTPLALKAPANIIASPGNGEVTLSWNAVTSAVEYNVFRISPDGQYTLLTPPAPGLSYTDRLVTNGTRYHYVVQTMSTKPGAYSYTVAASPTTLLPKAPSSLTAVPGDSWASLSWESSTGSSSYIVYCGTSIGGPYTFCGSVTSTVLDTGLTNGTTGYYVVAGVNEHGRSAFSPEASALASPLMTPHAAILSGWPLDQGTRLSWTEAPGAVSYAVFRRRSDESLYSDPPIALVSDLSFPAFTDSDPNLVNGTSYYYVVETRNASPSAPRSNEVLITPTDALPVPTNVAVIPGNTQATVTWDPVDGAYSYSILVAETYGGAAFMSRAVPTGSPKSTFSGLTNGLTYYFRVQSFGGEPSGYGDDVSATPSATLPLAPSGIAGYAGNTQVSLTWEEVPDATDYKVFRRTASSKWQLISGLPLSGTFYVDTGLTNGTKYYYVVAGVNSNGTGAWASNERSYTPTDYEKPAPTSIVVIPGNTQATITWDPVEGVDSYSIQIAQTPGGALVGQGSVNNGMTHYTATGLTNDQDYYFRVGSSGSSYSPDVRFTPKTNLPQAPTSVSAVSGNTQVSLTWASVETATGYTIYRRTRSGLFSAAPVGNVTGTTFFTDTGLDNGTEYIYSVSAINDIGEGPWSRTETYVTPASKKTLAPTNINGIPGNTQMTVTWDPAVGATDYFVTVATSPGGPQYTTGSTSHGMTSATISGLTNGITYYARVRVNSFYGSAEYGETIITPSADLPMAPVSLSCKASGNTQATLTWNTVDGAVSYKVHRRTESSAWSSAPVGTTASPLFGDEGLTNGVDYYYVVAAENGDGTGAWSSSEVKCSPSGAAPFAPTNVIVTPGNTQVFLTWNPVAGATQYNILRSSSPGGPLTSIYSSNTPEYMATNLENDQSYYFWIQARNDQNDLSAYSEEVLAIPSSVMVDTDNDGIADIWEMSNFRDLEACDDCTDYDNDGYTDLQEFLNQQSSLRDPAGHQYDPKTKNAPGGTGYNYGGTSGAKFWNLMLPAILSGNNAR